MAILNKASDSKKCKNFPPYGRQNYMHAGNSAKIGSSAQNGQLLQNINSSQSGFIFHKMGHSSVNRPLLHFLKKVFCKDIIVKKRPGPRCFFFYKVGEWSFAKISFRYEVNFASSFRYKTF